MASMIGGVNQEFDYEFCDSEQQNIQSPEIQEVMGIFNKALKQRHDGKALLITSAVVLGVGALALAGVGAVTGAGVLALTIGLPVLVAVAVAAAVVALALFLPGIIMNVQGNNSIKTNCEDCTQNKHDSRVVAQLINNDEYELLDALTPYFKGSWGENEVKKAFQWMLEKSFMELNEDGFADCNSARIELALKHGADINAKVGGKGLIFHIIKNNDVNALKLFLKYKPNLKVADDDAYSLLPRAISSNKEDDGTDKYKAQRKIAKEMMDLLLPYCKDSINDVADGGHPPLHRVGLLMPISGYWTKEVLTWMIKNGADINGVDSDENTLLIHAVEFENVDMVKFLLDLNADPNKKNKEGKTALSVAYKKNSGYFKSDKLDAIITILCEETSIERRLSKGLSALSHR